MNASMPFATRKALLEAARQGVSKRTSTSLRVAKDSVSTVQPVGARCFRFTLSTSSVDRASDVVNQAGWDLRAYKSNPVVLLDHGMHPVLGGLPIGRTIDIRTEGGKLKATVELDAATVPVTGPYAEMVKLKLEARTLFACSVGFRPLDFDIADRDADVLGLDFHRQELTEWSIVGVPCNPDAVLDLENDLQAGVVSAVSAAAPKGTRQLTPATHRLNLHDQINRRWPG